MPSRTFDEACECMQSMITIMPRLWALSIRYLTSSGFPEREDIAKKLVTWYPNEA